MRVKKPKCGICNHPGFKALDYDDELRPVKLVFQCDKCKNSWSSGRTGKDLVNFAINKEEAKKYSEVYYKINKQLRILK